MQTELIFWDPRRPLKFEDFTALERDTIKVGNLGRFKGAQSELEFNFTTSQFSSNTVPEIQVFTAFDPNKSWMLLKTPITLEHEQIHFNIAELYARKMRKSIDSLRKLNTVDFQHYKDQINTWKKKYDNYDILFDKDIDARIYYVNGKFLSDKNPKQKIWKEKVEKELKMLSDYTKN